MFLLNFFKILIATLIIKTSFVTANWWYLGLQAKSVFDSAPHDLYETKTKPLMNTENLYEINKIKSDSIEKLIVLRKYCRNLNVLTSPVQRKLCQKNVKIVDIFARAAKLAIEECQHQFQYKRWNCSVYNNTDVFGKLLETRSREISFIYAINSAAAMYEITRACQKGDLKKCSCKDQQERNLEHSSSNNQIKQNFEWAGCTDNVLFGHKLSKRFVDSKEYYGTLSKPLKLSSNRRENIYLNKEYKLMNLHNNEVGRRTILKNMKQVCKCHGVSGSCTLKVCWNVMPEFRIIGDQLLKRYHQAMQLKDSAVKNRVQTLKTIINRRNRQVNSKNERNQKDELIFIDKSPNFCKLNSDVDIPNTTGRICNTVSFTDKKLTSKNNELNSRDSCEHLCCGRGYYSIETVTEEECDCQFQWCCSVKCKMCKKKVIKFYCN